MQKCEFCTQKKTLNMTMKVDNILTQATTSLHVKFCSILAHHSYAFRSIYLSLVSCNILCVKWPPQIGSGGYSYVFSQKYSWVFLALQIWIHFVWYNFWSYDQVFIPKNQLHVSVAKTISNKTNIVSQLKTSYEKPLGSYDIFVNLIEGFFEPLL